MLCATSRQNVSSKWSIRNIAEGKQNRFYFHNYSDPISAPLVLMWRWRCIVSFRSVASIVILKMSILMMSIAMLPKKSWLVAITTLLEWSYNWKRRSATTTGDCSHSDLQQTVLLKNSFSWQGYSRISNLFKGILPFLQFLHDACHT